MDGIYCGAPPLPGEIWTEWNFDPVLLIALAALGFFVRHDRLQLLAVLVLVVAFVSPLCALSSALFSARVVHHVLLIAVAAPLFAQGFRNRRQTGPALPFTISTLILWAWHIPGAYGLALSFIPVYWLMQLTLLGSAVWFWRSVLDDTGSPVDSVLFIIASFAAMGMLGAILTFAPDPLYAAHAVAPLSWGLTPLDDQRLGGLVMWVPAGIPYAIATALLVRRSWARLSIGAA